MSSRKQVKLISLEGIIAVGKTTLMNRLREDYNENTNVVFLCEDSENWSKNGTLGAMYEGTLSSAQFQHQVLANQFAQLIKAVTTPGVDTIITDRTVWSGFYVFGKANIHNEMERRSYQYAFAQLQSVLLSLADIELHCVFLDVDVDETIRRSIVRNHNEDAGVPAAYQDLLWTLHHSYFESVLNDNVSQDCLPEAERKATPYVSGNVHGIDANKPKDEVLAKGRKIIQQVLAPHSASHPFGPTESLQAKEVVVACAVACQ